MRFVLPVALVLLLGACSSSGPIYQPAELESFTAEIRVDRLWNISAGGGSQDEVYDRLIPLIEANVLYAAGTDGEVNAVSTEKGKRLWTQDLDLTLSAGIGSDGVSLFVAAVNEVVALDLEKGEVKWRAPVATEVLAAPVAALGYVVVRVGDGSVYGFDSASGREIWHMNNSEPSLTLRGEGRPVIIGDAVLFGTSDGHLKAVKLFDGSLIWQAVVATPQGRNDIERMVDVDAEPVIVGDTVYVSAYQGRVVALSLATGAVLWSRDYGSAVGLTVDHGYLYLVDDAGHVWALDQNNGASLWKNDKLAYRRLTSPVIMDDTLVVGDFEGYVHWLSPEDGRLIGRYQLDDAMRVPAVIRDGVGYFRSIDGDVEALRIEKK